MNLREEAALLTDYYIQQGSGYGGNIYQGVQYQKGYGIGKGRGKNIFENILMYIQYSSY